MEEVEDVFLVVGVIDVLRIVWKVKMIEYFRLFVYDKYVVYNDYIFFKRMWYDVMYLDNEILLLDFFIWFDEDGNLVKNVVDI